MNDRADTFQGGEARGALSWAFIKTLQQQGPNQSYLQLLNNIRAVLEANYSQKPQLSSSHPLGEHFFVTSSFRYMFTCQADWWLDVNLLFVM